MLIEIPRSLLEGVVIKNSRGLCLLLPLELIRLYLKQICFPFEPKEFIAFRAFRNADIDFEYDDFELTASAVAHKKDARQTCVFRFRWSLLIFRKY